MISADFLAQRTFNQLQHIQHGKIEWQDNDTYIFGEKKGDMQARVTIHNRDFYRKFIFRGTIGAAESFIDGDWSCDNLTKLIYIIIVNQAIFYNLDSKLAFVSHLIRAFKHLISLNHVKKSRQNILRHYDLSNQFFNLILDKRMIYSCALFDNENTDLDTAQEAKLKLICDKLQLKASDHLLEIGTGWGGLAIYAAQHYGCKVTTTTISDQQYSFAKQQIAKLQLTDKIQVIKQDYRHLSGVYDKLVSIEMIEAVGHQYLNTFFKVCDDLLKPGGKYLLQAITIKDSEFDRYKREIDFIKAYIFPGGCLPSVKIIKHIVSNKTRLQIENIQDIGSHYATTLEIWHQRLLDNYQHIKSIGFDDAFIRMFQFYFCYCEAGFLSGNISNQQILMAKP